MVHPVYNLLYVFRKMNNHFLRKTTVGGHIIFCRSKYYSNSINIEIFRILNSKGIQNLYAINLEGNFRLLMYGRARLHLHTVIRLA